MLSLLGVKGEIFFSVVANRMTKYMTENDYIDTSMQKRGQPGFPESINVYWIR